jgi:hypothetical protein
MKSEAGQGQMDLQVAHRVTWFAPDRPVDGGTLFIRPESKDPGDGVGVDSGSGSDSTP